MSISVSSNGGELAVDFRNIGPRTLRRLTTVVREAGTDVRDEWRDNATESSGAHGKHYPARIQAHTSGLTSDIYPSGRPQGEMTGFELGSRNQPPHLDGQRAIDLLGPRIVRRFESVLVF